MSDVNCKVFVGNVSEEVRKSELRSEFEKFGEVVDVYISTGYAFITYADPLAAADAIKDMDGITYMGEKLRVEISRGRTGLSDSRGGRGGYDSYRGGRGGSYDRGGRGGYDNSYRGRGGYDNYRGRGGYDNYRGRGGGGYESSYRGGRGGSYDRGGRGGYDRGRGGGGGYRGRGDYLDSGSSSRRSPPPSDSRRDDGYDNRGYRGGGDRGGYRGGGEYRGRGEYRGGGGGSYHRDRSPQPSTSYGGGGRGYDRGGYQHREPYYSRGGGGGGGEGEYQDRRPEGGSSSRHYDAPPSRDYDRPGPSRRPDYLDEDRGSSARYRSRSPVERYASSSRGSYEPRGPYRGRGGYRGGSRGGGGDYPPPRRDDYYDSRPPPPRNRSPSTRSYHSDR